MSPVALAWEQFRFERKLFWRNPSAAFFNFVLPLLLLVLIATAFSSDADELEVLIPGIAGMGVLATTFTALAFNLTMLRDEGVLKRIRGTPMPAGAYLGRLHRLGDAQRRPPGGDGRDDRATSSTAWTGRRTRCCWSASRCSAWSASRRSGSRSRTRSRTRTSAPAYTNAVFLPLIFISGVFYSADDLPEALKAIAEALPLKHLIDGLSAGDRGRGRRHRHAPRSWWPRWAAAGLFLAVRFFRWE